MSSLFSLIVGTVVGLTQFRIKRLFAYSTISHVGFILLALGISSIESTQAFIFYLTQYTISNLNAFVILIAIGFSLDCYTSDNKEHEELMDKTNSPIQLINQLKGYFYINPVLAISSAITIFSFVGVPPLVGFFGKQMVLSAALDKGLIFLSLVAILTSVIGGVYYLSIITEMFFSKPEYKVNTLLENLTLKGNILDQNKAVVKNVSFNYNNIAISSPIAFVIISAHCTLLSETEVRLGTYCFLAGNCYLVAGGNHAFSDLTKPILLQPSLSQGGIRVGDDVWLGAGTLVLDRVTIGSSSIVGAGSAVTGPLPEYSFARGARMLKIQDRRGEPES